MENLLEKIQKQYQQNIPFVAYRKPNTKSILAFFQHNSELHISLNYKESGFIFAPFDDKKEAVLIPENKSDFFKEEITFSSEDVITPTFSSEEFSKENHVNIVDRAIKAIQEKEFRKVVISRKELVELTNFELIEVFKRLLMAYSTAMVYVWFHPKVGLWLGATPETLVKINENNFETMSLAGTQVYKGTTNVTWQEKELDEQQVVTDYIIEKLTPICEQISAKNVETIKAGSLLHLKTHVTGRLKAQNSELITGLHPTPAVCGLPKEKAKEFILKNENYNREFYTGFLGELNLMLNNQCKVSNLFVNLRCMQIKNKKAFIYVGGGITKESNSIKEWQETVAKAKIMKSIL